MPEISSKFSKTLIVWYLQNKRDLPWRNETEPYFIWLSEIMLQQTRVAQGLPYYERFVQTFPTVSDLANASEESVLKLWQGLGYYSRARNLHHTAKVVAHELDGSFPNSYKELLKLKGIGDYTASAIASICFGESSAVVDGNVYRVLSRVFGIDTPINSTAGQKEFKALAQELIDAEQPGTFNQAIMEFGARHCVPQNPDCDNCIFAHRCEAKRKDRVKELPVKTKKQKIKQRHFNYIVLLSENNETTLLEKRNGKGIWQNLYQFPLIESETEITSEGITANATFRKLIEEIGVREPILYNDNPVIHKLSHQHLHTKFWVVSDAENINGAVPVSEIKTYPVPVLIENFISEFPPFQN
ncbi:A/G-specific adenine glycosylase [Aureitalea sp. L0-47]|uniref:A/G-specific adenine glycosylase n=1 Tax=Aureitalea sp. L0-47 TaxID=2816962 RepID=UPI002237AD74|nr:A/G-specific adenine glycosylase [Aureitalea sp. L0-47]MCW5518392.1 A/G-specific adenine glycosylase [Aureitalea sp. L0-47]